MEATLDMDHIAKNLGAYRRGKIVERRIFRGFRPGR